MSLLSIIGPITEIWGPKNIVNMLAENRPLTKILMLIGVITVLELLKALFSGGELQKIAEQEYQSFLDNTVGW